MELVFRKNHIGREEDYLVLREGVGLARVYLIDEGPQAGHWTWSIYCFATAPAWLSGVADSLDEAKKALQAALERAESEGMKDFRDHPSYMGEAKKRGV